MRAQASLRAIACAAIFCASAALTASIQAGCSGEDTPLARGEPIIVQGGYFKAGPLPGSPPAADAGAPLKAPHVTALESANNVLRPGESGKSLNGRTTTDGYSIGVRFADLGTGYWVVPVDAPDPVAGGELGWALRIDVARDVPAGLHPLRLAAIDEHGKAGTQTEIATCVTRAVPDNLNACDPTIEPPAVVLSLAWDADVDLDLLLVAPDGTIADPKHPSTAKGADGGAPVVDPSKDGVFDRDGNGGCVVDGARRESIVWQSKPAPGQYLVYANLFSACGQDAVRFTATLWLSKKTSDTEWTMEPGLEASGELVASDANGGAALGLYLTGYAIQ